jgi:hypothetical protein
MVEDNSRQVELLVKIAQAQQQSIEALKMQVQTLLAEKSILKGKRMPLEIVGAPSPAIEKYLKAVYGNKKKKKYANLAKVIVTAVVKTYESGSVVMSLDKVMTDGKILHLKNFCAYGSTIKKYE